MPRPVRRHAPEPFSANVAVQTVPFRFGLTTHGVHFTRVRVSVAGVLVPPQRAVNT
jgi:hypothetical protein